MKVLLHSNLLSCDEMNINGQYPLHLASIKGHEAVVKLFLDENTAANKQNRDGYTPLQLAAMYGNEGVVRKLVEARKTRQSANRVYRKALSPVVLGQPDSDNDSDDDMSSSSSSSSDSSNFMDDSNSQPPPLHLAAKAGHSRVVRLLVELNKEDINATFEEEGTPLHCAVIGEKPEVVGTLIDLHADLNKKRFSGWGALHLACRERLTAIIKQLIDAGANINLPTSNGSPPLSVAAQEGHLEGVQLLLNAGANPNQCNKKGVGPLYRAIFCQSVECVYALLNAGADPFKEMEVLYIRTPYKLALDQGKDIMDALKRHTQGLLITAARLGDVPELKRLLDFEVDINGQDECGRTALFWASVKGHQEIIKVLHEHKAEHMIPDKDNLTCFDVATLNPTTLTLLRILFLGLSKDTLLEDGGEYNCKYVRKSGYLGYLRCNMCREVPMDGYFFRKYLLYHISLAAVLLFADGHFLYDLQDCCACGCTPTSKWVGYDICESCHKKALFCDDEHKRRYFKGISRATDIGYIVAIWRSYDWESGKQSSYLYPASKTREVAGQGSEAAGGMNESVGPVRERVRREADREATGRMSHEGIYWGGINEEINTDIMEEIMEEAGDGMGVEAKAETGEGTTLAQ